jgi:hypothetical protein
MGDFVAIIQLFLPTAGRAIRLARPKWGSENLFGIVDRWWGCFARSTSQWGRYRAWQEFPESGENIESPPPPFLLKSQCNSG